MMLQREAASYVDLWNDERNWHFARQVYFARRDPRLIVPKWSSQLQRGEVSHTLNFGHWAAYLVLALLIGPPVAMFLATLLGTP